MLLLGQKPLGSHEVTGCVLVVLKLLDFTSFEDTELIPWDEAKEPLLRLATTPPPPTARICFLMEYAGFLIGVGSKNDRWFYVDVQGSPRAPSGGALYTEFSTLLELVDVVLLPEGLARQPRLTVEFFLLFSHLRNFFPHKQNQWSPVEAL